MIAGLGNPGDKYQKSRHNAGFWFLDALAKQQALNFSYEARFQGELAKFNFEGDKVFLLKPMTFMNRSGTAVAAVARYFGIEPQRMLVVHDDIDFDVAVVRLKKGGGHGGHNGLKDIIQYLNTGDFYRLRIGVGRPPDANQVISYVLQSPSTAESLELERAIDGALDLIPELLRGEMQAVVNRLHRPKCEQLKSNGENG